MSKTMFQLGMLAFSLWLVAGALAAAEPVSEEKKTTYQAKQGLYEVQTAREIVLKDAGRQKELSLRLSWPLQEGRYPVIIFSHGMFGSKDGYEPLVKYWVERGYVVVRPTHEDSLALLRRREEKIDRKALLDHMQTLKGWEGRIDDIRLILDSLPALPSLAKGLSDRMDTSRIAMAGHSFGAFTSQLLGGATIQRREDAAIERFSDPRPRAFILLSPQGQGVPGLHEQSWDDFNRPQLTVTGSQDSGRNDQAAEWRMEPYRRSPEGDKYLLFLDKASHTLGGIAGLPIRRNQTENAELEPAFLECVQVATTAFLDSYLKDSTCARAFLDVQKLNALNAAELTFEKK